MNKHIHKIEVYVLCTGEFVSENDTEILDIEEDMEGLDILTFKCPECGEIHKSRRYG